jgi:L-lactate dehydrogenase (cytochrome)
VDLTTFRTSKETPKISSKAYKSAALPIEMCINLNDMEYAAKKVLSERAWIYYSSAAEDLHSHHNNLHDWDRISFRPRILRDVKRINMQRKILGFNSSLPFFIAPAAMARLGHPDGELCLARGAGRHDIPYCVSNASSVSHADLVQCLDEERAGGCLIFQLYAKKKRQDTIQHIRRARKLGFKALVITVDTAVVGIREEDDRYRVKEALSKSQKYVPFWEAGSKDDDFVIRGAHSSTLNWDDISWIKEEWGNSGPVAIKGVQTAEDAKIACEMGINGIYLSNHGGRQLDSAPSSLRILIEMRKFCPEVFDKCDVLVDGGVRRSRDALKALCLGATAVGFGRPFMYALSAYGTEGVVKTIQSKRLCVVPKFAFLELRYLTFVSSAA